MVSSGRVGTDSYRLACSNEHTLVIALKLPSKAHTDVSSRAPWIERDCPMGNWGSFAERIGQPCKLVEHRALEYRYCELSVSRRKAWIEINCPSKKGLRRLVVRDADAPRVPEPTLISFPGIQTFRCLANRAMP